MQDQCIKVYVAGKVGQSEGAIRALIKKIEALGYQVTYDWTLNPIRKPFEGNSAAPGASKRMLRAVMEADIVVVLCPAEGGVGLHVETGVALGISAALELIQGERRRRIYLVGEGNNRSVFHFDESVMRVDSVAALFEEHLQALTMA